MDEQIFGELRKLNKINDRIRRKEVVRRPFGRRVVELRQLVRELDDLAKWRDREVQ